MKHCCTCEQTKPLECFSKNKRQKDGYQTQCKDCAREYLKGYYRANKQKWQSPEYKDRKAAWHSANLDIERAKGRERAKAKVQRIREQVGQKECHCCHEVKPAQAFARRRSVGGDGLEDVCKPCKQRRRVEKKLAGLVQRTEKRCPMCGVVKPISEFYIQKRNGLPHCHCKPCANKRSIECVKKYRDRRLVRDRAWRAKNPDRTREYERRYKERFPEKVKAKKRAGHIRRKMRLKKIKGTGYTGRDILKLLRIQLGKCKVCEADISTNYHVDHIVPVSRGGTNEKSNIQLLCPTCNMSKGNKTMEEFLRYRSQRRRICLQGSTKALIV